MNSRKMIKSAFESMMFVWGEPLDVKTAADVLDISKEEAMYTEEEQELINIFLAGASTDVYRQWVAGGKKVPMDKVIQIIGNLLENGVSSMREKNEVYFGEIGQDF